MKKKTWKAWTNEEDDLLVDLCKKGIKYEDMSPVFNRSKEAINVRARILKVSNNYINRLYSFDQHFWSQLTPTVAYYAGLSSADCTLYKKRGESYVYSMSLFKGDESLLCSLKDDIKYTGPLHHTLAKLKGKEYPQVRLAISSNKQWFLDLEKYWNIVPNKTYRLGPPNIINEYLQLCWLIGLNDGDGCIYFDKERKKLSFSFRSGGIKALEWVKYLTDKYFDFSCYRIERNVRSLGAWSEKCYTYTIGGLSALLMYEHLKKFPVPKLDRKWNRPEIDEYLIEYKQKNGKRYENCVINLPQL